MPAKKKSETPPVAPAPSPAAPIAPEPPQPSPSITIKRVSNGFVAEIFQAGGDFGREREKRVARTPAELGAIIAEWATPTPKTPRKPRVEYPA
jgi:hypothetical protein